MRRIAAVLCVLALCLTGCARKAGTFRDPRDGRTYRTVSLFGRTWLAENLAYKTDKGSCLAYGGDPGNASRYGYLYDRQAAEAACPPGWHLPSVAEWHALIDALGGSGMAGGKMKSARAWSRPGADGAAGCGFEALPAGWYDRLDQAFEDLGQFAFFWTAGQGDDGSFCSACSLTDDAATAYVGYSFRSESGYSVRCVADRESGYGGGRRTVGVSAEFLTGNRFILTENAFRSEITFYSASEYAMENSQLQGGEGCYKTPGTYRISDGKVLLRPDGAASAETGFLLEDYGYGKVLACPSVDGKALPGRPAGGGPAAYAVVDGKRGTQDIRSDARIIADFLGPNPHAGISNGNSREACLLTGRWVDTRDPGSAHEFTESSWLRFRDGKPAQSLEIKLADRSLGPEVYFGIGPFPGAPWKGWKNGTFINAYDKATDTLESYAYVVDGDILRIIDGGATGRMTLERKP